MGTQNSLKKFVSFPITYVHMIPLLITMVNWEFVKKCRRLVDGCWKCNWKNKYSQFTYRKPEDRDVIKQKKLLGGIEQFHEKNFRSNVYLLNQLLHDWFFIIQHYTHDFTWTIMSRTMSLEMHSLILPVLLTKCEIDKWLRCLTNLQSWSSKCKTSFQYNDIMA